MLIFFARRDLSHEPTAAQRDARACIAGNFICRFRRGFVDESWQLRAVGRRFVEPAVNVARAAGYCVSTRAQAGCPRYSYRLVITAKGRMEIASLIETFWPS